MAGQTPLNMMRQPSQRLRRPRAVPARRPRGRMWTIAATALVVVIVLALGWTWLWYFAAGIADRTLAGWVERETAAGRNYSCGSQAIGGFPFRIAVSCADAVAAVNSEHPPFTVWAKSITVDAEVYHPTRLVADIVGPLTLAQTNQPPDLVANWSRARISVAGVPPDPDSVAFTLDRPRVDHAGSAGGGETALLFKADHADLQGRVIDGSPRNNPVIEAVLHVAGATAPSLHPILAVPTSTDIDAVLRGIKDMGPKPWAARFREMQAAGGNIEIKYLRITQPDAVIVGTGTLTVNANGKLDGLIKVAIVGIDTIVPRLGIDRLIGSGLDHVTGASGPSAQGLGALDRLLPGLSGVVRQSANASVVENLKKMGQPTEIDKKPAIVLPLRVSDGSIYLGMIPLGQVPPLF